MTTWTGVPWGTMPAEISSNLLFAGPGPVPATVAGATWTEISAVFTEAAAEMCSIAADLRNNWEGIGADVASAKMLAFSGWLSDIAVTATADAGKAAAQATANTVARVMMPTEAEIAATRAVVKSLQVLGECTDILGFTGVGIVVPAIIKGAQAAAEVAEHELDVRAAVAMETYEVASEVTAIVPTIYIPAPFMANGLALNPLEFIQQALELGVAIERGIATDAQKIKTEATVLDVQLNKERIKLARAKAEAEKLMGKLHKVQNAAQQVASSVKSAFNTISNLAPSVNGTGEHETKQENVLGSLIKTGLNSAKIQVEKIAGGSQTSNIKQPDINLSQVNQNYSLTNKYQINSPKLTVSTITPMSNTKIGLKGVSTTPAVFSPGSLDKFNSKLRNSVGLNSSSVNTAKNSTGVSGLKRTNAGEINPVGMMKPKDKDKKPTSTTKEYLSEFSEVEANFKISGSVAPPVIGGERND